MRNRFSPKWSPFLHHSRLRPLQPYHLFITRRCLTTTRASFNRQAKNSNEGRFLVPGATMATIIMLGALHARRMYDDKKLQEARDKGIEFEFSPDVKAAFLRLLPLRSISRFWGLVTSMEIPVSLRPFVYKAWARAFHSNLEEVALPLDNYASLRDFFVRTLTEGSRPVDPDSYCLVSPVDGTVLRCGELTQPGSMIEQVKGFSYSASSLLGANTFLPVNVREDMVGVHDEENSVPYNEQKLVANGSSRRSWWRVSLASPKVRDPISTCPLKGLFYCVIYLNPGDYHRVHSPVDWNVFLRRHFSGSLFPLNERATRTIRNLHVENERVVLEGQWAEGFMAIVAIGATNIGSIELSIEPELKTNRPRKRLLHMDRPDERVYEPEGIGLTLNKGEELAAFNMGSTVVLVFQAPVCDSLGKDGAASKFNFCVKNGERVRVGEAIGRWHNL